MARTASRLQAKVKVLGLSKYVIFAGRIAESEKVAHYNLADVFVMPSYGEGFGIALIEAAACGIPIVGSSADGSRDALLNGRLGRLVDPKKPDELIEAITAALAVRGAGGTQRSGRDLRCWPLSGPRLALDERADRARSRMILAVERVPGAMSMPVAGASAAPAARWVGRLRHLGVFVLALACIGAGAWLAREPLLRGAADLWIVSDEVTQADAVAVLGGSVEVRPFAAADLYHRGLVKKVLVSNNQESRAVNPWRYSRTHGGESARAVEIGRAGERDRDVRAGERKHKRRSDCAAGMGRAPRRKEHHHSHRGVRRQACALDFQSRICRAGHPYPAAVA